METPEDRNQWEDGFGKLAQNFFVDFYEKLSEAQQNVFQFEFSDDGGQLLKEQQELNVFTRQKMWSFQPRMTIPILTHMAEQGDGKEKYPVLLELLRLHGHIQHIQYLPLILNLQQRLVQFFRYRDLQEWREVSIEQFATRLDHDDTILDSVRHILKIWNYLKETAYLRIPAELQDVNKRNLKILDLLPRDPSVTQLVTKYLITVQNDCVSKAQNQEHREISTEDVKACHVIICHPEQDFLQAAMSNIDYVVNEDGTNSTNYNFKTLENHLVMRFICEKPCINLTTIPSFEFNPVKTLCSFFISSKDKLEPLNMDDKNYIMNKFRNLSDISAALAALKIAIGFLELSFVQPDMLLVDYMKRELRMEDRAQHLNLQVLQTSKVKHIQSLWEVLSAKRSMMLIQMKQNPFYMINEEFHADIIETEAEQLNSELSKLRNIDLFITELHDLIMNMENKEVKSSWTITETFEPLLNEKNIDESCIENLLSPLREDLKMKHVIAVWKAAVQRRSM